MNKLLITLLSLGILLALDNDKITCSHMKSSMKMIENPQYATRNQQDYDVKFYDINLEISPDSETIGGFLTVILYSEIDNLTHVELDLTNSLTVNQVTDSELNSLLYTHNDRILDVSLNNPINADELVEFTINYDGAPEYSDFGSFGFSSAHGEDMIWTLSEPYGSRNWWPCKDTPTDKADSVNITITVPENLLVASNGLLVNTTYQNEKATYYWEEGYPIATYLVSLAIYPYQVFYDWFVYGENDSMRLDYYVYPQHYNQYYDNYMLTKDMISGFSDRFGLYPFIEEKYGHADFVWGGGMEHQTMTSMGGYSQYLISHELGHQWWGDMVTCANFHHIWLNEGFATYSQAMWEELHNGGIDALHDEMSTKQYWGSGTIFVDDTTNVWNIFNGSLSYNKASWVLHMLRHILGDETFFAGLQEYGDQYRFSSAVTEDFTAIMSEVSGRDLAPFINRWIYGEYYPEYVSTPTAIELVNENWKVDVQISQTQDSPIFEMPVDVVIETDTDTYTFVAEVTEQNQLFSFIVDGVPLQVNLDPDHWILRSVDNNEIEFLEILVPYNLTVSQAENGLELNWEWDGNYDDIRGFAIFKELDNLQCEQDEMLSCDGICLPFSYLSWLGDGDCDTEFSAFNCQVYSHNFGDCDGVLEVNFRDENSFIKQIQLRDDFYFAGASPDTNHIVENVTEDCFYVMAFAVSDSVNVAFSEPSDLVCYQEATITDNQIATNFKLFNCHPNPFNPKTVISYSVPVETNGRLTLQIYNITGQPVEELVNSSSTQVAGYHSVVWDAENHPSGIYFAELQIGNSVQTKKLLLLK
ncbi:MAG: T9SS type A sorting domain-containing protein [Candidatus Marinimicrobia bacterium]|nr:T9SS type A sorting domain-containing protein [Candidatus Neomarinimicrobiota bacterium]MBL7023689.1 T9SS type A sorting domain-containing protein [Candidatus Neomarinimicrobiota bacterium]